MISLRTAMFLFLALAILAFFLLTGQTRNFVWILLAGLAVKVLVAAKRRSLDE